MEKEIKQAAEILRAVKHKFRYKIIDFILKNENCCNVGTLQNKFHVSQSVMSQHLAILRNAGIVTCQRNAKFVDYAVNEKRLNKIVNLCNNIIDA